MQAFGREVAVKSLTTILAGVGTTSLLTVWGTLKLLVPRIATSHQLSTRESFAWALAIGLIAVLIIESIAFAGWVRWRKTPQWILDSSGGIKPTVTLTHKGEATKYTVTGKVIEMTGVVVNQWPAQYSCELQVAGLDGQWEATLGDGQWANVVLGSAEPVYGSSGVLGDKVVVGHQLVVRRGKYGHHAPMPDAGAVVELQIRPESATAVARRFRLVRNEQTVEVTTL